MVILSRFAQPGHPYLSYCSHCATPPSLDTPLHRDTHSNSVVRKLTNFQPSSEKAEGKNSSVDFFRLKCATHKEQEGDSCRIWEEDE